MMPFRDRNQAGEVLADLLAEKVDLHDADALVLALPRGGVAVGYQIAHRFNAPLDILLVRKLGVPGQEELAMGAIAEGGYQVLNDDVVGPLNIPPHIIDQVAESEGRELQRRAREYRGDAPPLEVRGRTVILVDDGLATGATMRVAARAIRARQPARLIIAVPVAAPDTCAAMADEADEVVCAITPDNFSAVGRWYQYFTQTTDEEVRNLLAEARHFVATP